jgi:amidase
MPSHEFVPSHYFRTLGSHEPVLVIADGDTLVTSSVDAGGFDSADEQVTEGGNPMTGPFFIDGAQPGDTLAVHIDRLTPNRSRGVSRRMLAPGSVDPGHVPNLPWLDDGDRGWAEWEVDVGAWTATLVEPDTKLGRLELPLAPMLGCFGVAPPGGQAISTATSWVHGGNMDYRGFVSGATCYFPVFVPGALLFLGDGHALQGAGEMSGSGIEISLDIQVSVRVLKGVTGRWPRGEDSDHIFTVGNARPLDQAVQHATTEMLQWLQDGYGLDPVGANILLSQCVEYDLGNMFDPAYTMVCKMPKRLLKEKPLGGEQ